MSGRTTPAANSTGLTESAGIEMKPAYFPGRAPVDTYGNGGFRFADMSHRGSILCLPSGIYGWSAQDVGQFNVGLFEKVWEESGIEIMLVGTGINLSPLPPRLKSKFDKHNIRVDVMSTGSAARTFNVLLSEGRAVAAALLAVD